MYSCNKVDETGMIKYWFDVVHYNTMQHMLHQTMEMSLLLRSQPPTVEMSTRSSCSEVPLDVALVVGLRALLKGPTVGDCLDDVNPVVLQLPDESIWWLPQLRGIFFLVPLVTWTFTAANGWYFTTIIFTVHDKMYVDTCSSNISF